MLLRLLLGAALLPGFLLQTAAQTRPSILRSGPMVGYGEMTEVMLWVQLRGPGDVQYRFWPEGKKERAATTGRTRGQAEGDFAVHTLVRQLEPGTKYEFELLVDGKTVPVPHPLRFQSQPLWQWRTDPPVFTVAFGSCAYINDPPSDRPGRPFGTENGIFRSIAGKKPDVMLWLGDNTYYRELDWNTAAGMRARYAHTRAYADLQPLLGSAHHYAIWDDHDYGPNDSDRRYAMKDTALAVFRQFWANHTYGTAEVPGVFGRMTWGDVEFFLLDDRFHRSPNRMPDDAERTMFGREQLAWLKESLVSSGAPFKVVANGNQMLNPMAPFEALSACSREYRDLLAFIRERRIPGVVFISGDRHFAELIKLEEPGFYPLYDFTSSPLTAGTATVRADSVNPTRVPGTMLQGVHNFGLLRFEGPRTDRVLTMELCDAAGKVVWSRQLPAAELRPPGP
jgi:alkaline phosphatase D